MPEVLEEELTDEDILEDLISDFQVTWRKWTDIQLIDFIEVVFSVRIPNKVLTPGHASPAQFICDAFFERFDAAMVIANRTGGKTFNVAIINILNSLAKSNCESTQAGATRDQAKKGYGYFKDFIRVEGIRNRLSKVSTQTDTKFINNSKVEIITGSSTGLRCVKGNTLIDCVRDVFKYPKGIPIKDLVGKDIKLSSFDMKKQKFVIKKVKAIFESGVADELYRITFEQDNEIVNTFTGTNNHPIMLVDGKYEILENLKIDSLLMTKDLSRDCRVVNIEMMDGEAVYDINVPGTNNFVANGIVVHNSPHPQKACLDEIDLMDWSDIQTGFSMAQSGTDLDGEPIMAQNIFTSTRNSTEGPVHRLLKEAEDRGITIYKWNIFEVLETCTRKCRKDPDFGNCLAYNRIDKDGKESKMCGGLAHGADGYYTIPDFINKVRNLDIDRWVFEWLCDVAVSGKLVYGKAYKDEPPYIISPFDIPSNWHTWMGRDSGQHSRVIKFAEDPTTNIWYAIWALVLDDNQLYEDQVRWIKESPLWKKSEIMYCDPADPQAIEEFKRRGINAIKADNAVLAGIDSVKERLMRNWSVRDNDPVTKAERITPMPGLRIFNTLKSLREGLLRYSHPEKDDGIYNEDEVIKENDHDCDVLRYAVYSKGRVKGGSRGFKFVRSNL